MALRHTYPQRLLVMGTRLLAFVCSAQSAQAQSADRSSEAEAAPLRARLVPRPAKAQTASGAPRAPADSEVDRRPTQGPVTYSNPQSEGRGEQAAIVHRSGLISAPPVLPAWQNIVPPAGYVEDSRLNRTLLWTGGGLLALAYGGGLIYASTQKFEDGLGALAIPVLGPWLALGKRKFDCEFAVSSSVGEIEQSAASAQQCWTNEVKTSAFLTGLGVAQLVGSALLVVGILDKEKVWLRSDLADVRIQWDAQWGAETAGVRAWGSF